MPLTGPARLLPAAVTGLLLGWVTLAAAVQVATAGVALGAPAQGTAAQVWAVAELGAVAALGAALVLVARVAAGPFRPGRGLGPGRGRRRRRAGRGGRRFRGRRSGRDRCP